MLPRWKIMVRAPRALISLLSRSISFLTRPMNALRSLLTPLLLASIANALQEHAENPCYNKYLVRVQVTTNAQVHHVRPHAQVTAVEDPSSN